MEKNKNIFRYIAGACFVVCALLELEPMIPFHMSNLKYYLTYYVFSFLSVLLAAIAMFIADSRILAVSGAVGVFYSIIQIVDSLKNLAWYGFLGDLLVRNLSLMIVWIFVIIIALFSQKYGLTLGIATGAIWAIRSIYIILFNLKTYGSAPYNFQFYLYQICFIAGMVLMGMVVGSVSSKTSALYRPAGQYRESGPYGAGAPRRQYRRYDPNGTDRTPVQQNNNPAQNTPPPYYNSGRPGPGGPGAGIPNGGRNGAGGFGAGGSNAGGPNRNAQDYSARGQIDELARLKGLLDSGAITQEEYEIMKRKVIEM